MLTKFLSFTFNEEAKGQEIALISYNRLSSEIKNTSTYWMREKQNFYLYLCYLGQLKVNFNPIINFLNYSNNLEINL